MSRSEPEPANDVHGAQFDGATWNNILRIFGGRWRALAAFGFCYALMTALGYHFRSDPGIPAVMWPAAGVLFSAL